MILLLTKSKEKSSNQESLSEYAERIESNAKKKYIENISEAGIDPLLVPQQKFLKIDPECLLPEETSNLLAYLILETSYCMNKLFRAFMSLQGYCQIMTTFRDRIVVINSCNFPHCSTKDEDWD